MIHQNRFSRRALLTAVPLFFGVGEVSALAAAQHPRDFKGHWAGIVDLTPDDEDIEFFITKENRRTGKLKGEGSYKGEGFNIKGTVNKKGKVVLIWTSQLTGQRLEMELQMNQSGDAASGTFFLPNGVHGEVSVHKLG